MCSADDGLDGGAGTDAAATGSDGSTGLCTPNHDGMISSNELPLAAGRSAKFKIATNATISTAGTSNTDGTRDWDLSGALSGDTDTTVTLQSPTGAWWASSFPTATYATTLSSSSTLLGVFAVSATEVTLLGVVSPTSGEEQTELTYNPPAKILALPFTIGSTWTSTSAVTGTADGVPDTSYSEEYTSDADVAGTMKTPYGSFPVIRVGTDLTRTTGLETLATSRTFGWTAECFGTVATAVSQDFETGDEFTSAAEVDRLTP